MPTQPIEQPTLRSKSLRGNYFMSASIKLATASNTPHLSKVAQRENWVSVLWTVPALVFYLLFAIIPLFIALYLSFTNWNGLSTASWVGLQNWIALFSDSVT